MNMQTEAVARSARLTTAVDKVYQRRLQSAGRRFAERMERALETHAVKPSDMMAIDAWQSWPQYAIDLAQRWVLFWDTLRQRGDNYLEHQRAGMPPLLHFDYEIVVDGRQRPRPVNYALVRILPPPGVVVDPGRRPYVIIDPRAGHGPGIGGFKDDSQVGVALVDGHPVYFVIFFPKPEPGQTMLDVCAAEREFVHAVRERHPQAPRPVVVGNCQGGWAAMMVASSSPEDTGPVVINGAPLSYWGGAWSEGAGDNPMRYAGGLLGGSWLASLTADLGCGIFDGAHLVQNFENLNPSNTLWTKYYNLFSRIDTERERFLEFERWWGGHYLLSDAEINWIVQNLFVGNELAGGGVQRGRGEFFDLRAIRSPIVVFASLGDNITPPQQAFNWIADLYGSTEEIKARGQVIVGLLHRDVGHLGIFVSGRVARKEHKQIVSVLKSIEALTPGLWGMEIQERKSSEGRTEYEVSFVEHRLEEVAERLNRFNRADEQAFRAVAAVSDLSQRAYDLFTRPLVRAFANEATAQAVRALHPLRVQHWAMSSLNPLTWWLPAAARQVDAQRVQQVPESQPPRRMERLVSESVIASLDLYRDLRDAMSEAMFFTLYGNLFAFSMAEGAALAPAPSESGRELPWVKEALAAIDRGGYSEAVARAAFLLQRKGVPLPLSHIELKHKLVESERYRELLPALEWHEMRLVRGRQELIVTYEPELAVETLPTLLADPADRTRFLTLLERVVAEPDLPEATPEQLAMLKRIRTVLGSVGVRAAVARRPAATAGRTSRKAAARGLGEPATAKSG